MPKVLAFPWRRDVAARHGARRRTVDGTCGSGRAADRRPVSLRSRGLDHIVVPIGRDHAEAITALVSDVEAAAGVTQSGAWLPHVSLVAYDDLSRDAAVRAVRGSLADTAPFVMHAHGYGFFTGDRPSDLSLYVPVVRAAALDALHARLWGALGLAGARRAGWSAPDHWSPHLTIVDRTLDPQALGTAVTHLARRHHPSWSIPVDRVLLTGGWPDHTGVVLPLGSP